MTESLGPAWPSWTLRGTPYKLETIAELEKGRDEYGEARSDGAVISTYAQDAFEDLCLGPHLGRTGEIPPDGFKILDVSGAYWRGSERNPMLQRVHGTVWPSREALESYLRRREEVEKRDQRRLGSELDLFSVRPEEVGPGLALFHPKGALVRVLMEDYWQAPPEPPRRPQVPPKGASQVRGLRLRLRRAHDHEKRQEVLILRLRVPPDRQGRRFRPAPPRPERQRPVVRGPGVEGRQAIS